MDMASKDIRSILALAGDESLASLIQLGSLINSSLELPEVLTKVMCLVNQLLECEASSLLLIDEKTNKLIFHVTTGEKSAKLKTMTLSMGEGIAGWVAETGKPAIVNDVQSDPRHYVQTDTKLDFQTRSLLCIPMKSKDKIIGVLEAINKKESKLFENRDQILIELLADQAAIAIQNAKTYQKLLSDHENLKKEISGRFTFIAKSARMEHVLDMAKKVSQGSSTVLLRGKSGTGKEMMARMIHDHSPRASKPFIPVICSILSQSLLESELFGHEKGAFTGADSKKIGRFEMANGGTLFLDEIGTLSSETQLRLLRVLQERSFERVGGNETIHVDVRIIAATNADLEKEIEAKRFREDLYYRLKVIEILLPDLKERPEDIKPIAEYCLSFFSKEMGRAITGISPQAMKILQNYHWPGNIRELRNTIERSVVLTNSPVIQPEDLPQDLTQPSKKNEAGSHAVTLDEAEKEHIIRILNQSRGNKSRAAQLLGVSRNRLDRKIESYGIVTEE